MTVAEVKEMIYGHLSTAIYHPLFDVSTRYVGSERCDIDDCACPCHDGNEVVGEGGE